MSDEVPAYRPNELGAGAIVIPSESQGGGVYYNRRLRLSLRNYIELGARLELTSGEEQSPVPNPVQSGLPPNWSSVTFKEKFGLTPVARLGYTWFLPSERSHSPLGFGVLFEGAYSSRWGEVRGIESQGPNQLNLVSRDIQSQGWRLRAGGQLVCHLSSFLLRGEGGVDHLIDSFGSRTVPYVFLGVGYLFGISGKARLPQPPALPPDRDRDGVPDFEDACPDIPGVPTNDPRTHGCPPPPPDRDKDGIVDAEDACPDVPGVKTQDPQTNGCPPDRDRDGIPDSEDYCPDVPGIKSDEPKKNGCPAGN